ncbi:MAG: ABC transporter permease [Oscillospiraceae bacterium]
MKQQRGRKTPFELFSAGVLLLVALFIGGSILAVVGGGLPFLQKALQSQEVLFSLGLSLYTACISTLLCLALALPCAYALTRLHLPGGNFLETLIELPLSLPNLVLGLCLLMVFSSPVGKWLRGMGFPVVFDRRGIILAQMLVNLPFVIRLTRTAFAGVDRRLELIAGTLGATKWQCFRTITLPLSLHGLLTAGVLAWSRALGEFGATLMLVGVTRMKTETLPAGIYLHISTGENGMAMATAVILLVLSALSITLTGILNRRHQLQTRGVQS